MNWKRVKAIGKLLLLFGTPLLVVLALFGFGVYVGDLYRHGITSFEKEWLGLDVEVAPAHDAEGSADGSKEQAESEEEPEKDASGASPKEEPEKDASEDEPEPTPEQADEPEPKAAEPPARAQPEAPVVQPEPEPQPEPQVDPLDDALTSRLGVPVSVGIKVLVDDTLIQQHPDWIDYVQRTVSQASSIYQQQFGVTLELVSVGRWGVPTDGMSSGELLEDVEARPREAALLVAGLTGRPLDDRTAGKAFTPEIDSPYNGSAAVVYAHRGQHNEHVRGLLHELGHLFGALDITDPTSPGYQSGSWMSYAPVKPVQAPWIDPDNRARILARKDKPFAPPGAMQASPAAPTQEIPQ